MSGNVAPEVTTLTAEKRKALLARAVANEVHRGARIESQTDFQAVLVRGHRPNHLLHLILTLLTGGLWLIIWLIIAATGGEKRIVIDVDEYGLTNIQQ